MRKTQTFISSLFLALVMTIAFSVPPPVEAQMDDSSMGEVRKKRYRYRKRKHRLQLEGNFSPWHKDNEKKYFLDVDVLYGYNAGYFEVGPNIGLFSKGGGQFNVFFNAGGWAEFNFIKNTRKESFVPALGLKINYLLQERRRHYLLLAPYLSLKFFPASRTGFILSGYFDIQTNFDSFFKRVDLGLNFSIAYVHYFHH